MKNNLYFDADFKFLLLECQESASNTIHICLHTSEATNQRLKITVGDGAPQYEALNSDADVDFDLTNSLWQENGVTVLQLLNSDLTSEAVTLRFGKIPTASAAINRVNNTTFELRYQGQDEDESGGGGGSGAGEFNFVEVIRNIQHRLLDEPSGAEGAYNPFTQVVSIKWTDPDDITTNEPVPATWAGTVVVRKDGSAPLHRWDGVVEIVDETTRDSYAETYLEDNTAEENKTYYYGIFPYDERGWYRYTRVLMIETKPIPAPEITSLRAPHTTAFVEFTVSPDFTWDYVTLVYKKNSEPSSKTDGTAVNIAGMSSTEIENLKKLTLYYFKIYAQEHISGREFESTARAVRTGEPGTRLPAITEEIRILSSGTEAFETVETVTITQI